MRAQLMLPAADGRSSFLLFMCDRLVLLSASLPAAAGGMTLKWQVDDGPLHEKPVQAGPMFTLVEGGAEIEVRRSMRSGKLLTIKLESSVGDTEVAFAYGTDSRMSFAAAAQSMGVDETLATIGYNQLTLVIGQALKGENPAFIEWTRAASISLRQEQRIREAWEILPQVLDALHAIRGTSTEDKIGEMAFGQFWTKTDLKRLSMYDAASYREKNGPINDQFDWLAGACKKSGYMEPLP